MYAIMLKHYFQLRAPALQLYARSNKFVDKQEFLTSVDFRMFDTDASSLYTAIYNFVSNFRSSRSN